MPQMLSRKGVHGGTRPDVYRCRQETVRRRPFNWQSTPFAHNFLAELPEIDLQWAQGRTELRRPPLPRQHRPGIGPNARGDDVTGLQVGRAGALPQLFDEVQKRVQWAVEHIAAHALVDLGADLLQGDVHTRQQGGQFLRAACDLIQRHARPDQQAGVQARIRDRFWRPELPARRCD